MPVWLELERRRTRNAVDVGATPTAGSIVSGVCRKHPTLRRSWTRFDSWRGHWLKEIVLGVWRRHATLRRSQSRFDSWRGHSTLERVGRAAGCNPAEVGSIPTGVSRGGLTTESQRHREESAENKAVLKTGRP